MEIWIQCDKCNSRGTIEVPDLIPHVNGNPMISILVRKEICDHDILLFVDRNYKVRGQTRIDYTIGDKLPKLPREKKDSWMKKSGPKFKFWWLYHFSSTWHIAGWKILKGVRKIKAGIGIRIYRFGMRVPDEESSVVRILRNLAVKMSDNMKQSVNSARNDIRDEIRSLMPSFYSLSKLVEYNEKPAFRITGVLPPTREIMDEMNAHREEMKNMIRMYKVALCNS